MKPRKSKGQKIKWLMRRAKHRIWLAKKYGWYPRIKTERPMPERLTPEGHQATRSGVIPGTAVKDDPLKRKWKRSR